MAKKEGASEKRRALLRGLRRKQLHLSAQELGQNQADRLNICYQQHTHDQRDDEGNHLFGMASRPMPAVPQATNRLQPKGGVTWPTARFTQMIMAK